MADDKTNLLDALTDSRLPAVADPSRELPATGHERENADEPVEPREPRELDPASRGRKPEEVVDDDAKHVPVTREAKPVAKAKTYKIGDRELTIEQMIENGTIDNVVTSANQFPVIQRKYQDLLEKSASDLVRTDKPAAPAGPQITPEQITQGYAPIVAERVRLGYLEADFAEAYPIMAAQLAWHSDMIFEARQIAYALREWVGSQVQLRNAVAVKSNLDHSIDIVAAKHDPKNPATRIFETLKEKEVRDGFVMWLRKEVNPEIDKITPENIERLYMAYNADALLELTKGAEPEETTSRKRRAAGDGTGSRVVSPSAPKEKSLLDRLTESRLPAAD
jgi:hypothetical protein